MSKTCGTCRYAATPVWNEPCCRCMRTLKGPKSCWKRKQFRFFKWLGRLITCILIAMALMIAVPNVAHAAVLGNELDELQRIKVVEPTDDEIRLIAQVIWAEARGVDSRMEQAAVAWCILNRVDAGYGSIEEVVTAPAQFAYRRGLPVKEAMYELAKDVAARWVQEKRGAVEVGRVLPEDYLWFAGHGGHNWFRCEYRSKAYWDWSLPDPYSGDTDEN